jgi:hypothetical protein
MSVMAAGRKMGVSKVGRPISGLAAIAAKSIGVPRPNPFATSA